MVVDHLYFITLIDNLRRFPLLVALTKLFFPSHLAVRNRNSEYSRDQVEKCVLLLTLYFLNDVICSHPPGDYAKNLLERISLQL
jgi:hypothetical protein